ncbi:MAG: hypothetical protein AAF432_13985, partial [Planctomycetota bacterium]
EEALGLAMRAVRLVPDNPDIEDTMASALIGIGRDADALTHAERAVSLRPDDAGLRFREVEILLALGRHERAAAKLSRAGSLLDRKPAARELHHQSYEELRHAVQQASARAREDM